MTRFPVRTLRLPVLCVFLASANAIGMANAAPPQVTFDITELVECHDVTPAEFAALNGDERLVELTLRISSLFVGGDAAELTEIRYQIESPERTAMVMDYEPKTELASDIATSIVIDRKTETSRGIGLNAVGTPELMVKLTGNADLSKKSIEGERYELLPKLQPVLTSGTLNRGHGVYFKFKATNRTWLEGDKLFRMTLRVPAQWRADYLQVTCEAIGVKRGFVSSLNENVVCGRSAAMVTLYLAGDGRARHAAASMVEARGQLQRAAQQRNAEITRRSYPSVLHKVGAVLDVVQPSIAPGWLDDLIHSPAGHMYSVLPNRLPIDVRVAALDYLEAKNDVHQLASRSRLEQVAQHQTAQEETP